MGPKVQKGVKRKSEQAHKAGGKNRPAKKARTNKTQPEKKQEPVEEDFKVIALGKGLPQSQKPYVKWKPWDEPIHDWSQAPAGWNPQDNDIDERDIEAMIQRCKDRIDDGIMPEWWEKKLETYLLYQKQDEETIKYSGGLDLQTSRRIRTLEAMRRRILNDGDTDGKFETIEAILSAYFMKKMQWTDGLVTYWVRGQKICDGPKPFDWADYERYVKGHEEDCSFWVEGLNGPGPEPVNPTFCDVGDCLSQEPIDSLGLHKIEFALKVGRYEPEDVSQAPTEAPTEAPTAPLNPRELTDDQFFNMFTNIPSDPEPDQAQNTASVFPSNVAPESEMTDAPPLDPADKHVLLTFLDDTGSSVMVIHRSDLNVIEATNRRRAPTLGHITVSGLGVTHTMQTVRLYAAILNHKGKYMLEPEAVQVAICDMDPSQFHFRISGPWMRLKFWVGSKPNGQAKLLVATRRVSLLRGLEMDPIKGRPLAPGVPLLLPGSEGSI